MMATISTWWRGLGRFRPAAMLAHQKRDLERVCREQGCSRSQAAAIVAHYFRRLDT